jgi:hypothetical protein
MTAPLGSDVYQAAWRASAADDEDEDDVNV